MKTKSLVVVVVVVGHTWNQNVNLVLLLQAKDLPDLVMCSHTLPVLKICTVRSNDHRSTARSHTIARDVWCSSASEFVKNIEKRAGGLARDCSPSAAVTTIIFSVK